MRAPACLLVASAAWAGTTAHYAGGLAITRGDAGWVRLSAPGMRVWMAPGRYLLAEDGDAAPREYRHAVTGEAVLPTQRPWAELVPLEDATGATWLGKRYARLRTETDASWNSGPPPDTRVVLLRPDLMIGPASNARQKDDRRKWDYSDYEMVRFTEADYRTLAEAGVNCVRVDEAQRPWADALGLFHWGAPAAKLPYPAHLYRPLYLGPAMFLDEPAVHTRDFRLRPRFEKEPAFRRAVTPAIAFTEFEAEYAKSLEKAAPLANLYSWETMPATAAYQLTRDPVRPAAFVFEPPGRVGTRRTLPEWNMAYGTHFATDDARALTTVVFSFLRGAARLSGKQWGVSIYGAVDRGDAGWWLRHAYDLGATRFHFWDNYQLACVPFPEVLAHARMLRDYATAHPGRDLAQLRRRAEVLLTLPPGYNLGHVALGRGLLWGVGELNLERRNAHGRTYRDVMSKLFSEAERLLRAGVAFDIAGEWPGFAVPPGAGYRDVIRIGEDSAPPVRAEDPDAPGLVVDVKVEGLNAVATARVTERLAPVFYTHGTDRDGVYNNAMVLWELHGPAEEDYQFLMPKDMQPAVRRLPNGDTELEMRFTVPRPGRYRLRAATADTSGRTRVVWREWEAR